MLASIVVPVYNDPRVGRALDSLLMQREVDPPEILIVDGGSGSETHRVLDEYRHRVARVISEPDRGVYDAMNKGIALAQGDVIATLGADDVYADPFVLRDVLAAFEGGADAVYADVDYVTAAGRVMRHWRSGPLRRARFYAGWMPPHPTFFVRRHHLRELGAFDLSFRIAADYELTLRMLFKHKLSARYIPRVLVRMEHGGMSNRPANVLRANLEAYRAWRTNGLRGGLLVPVLKPASKLTQFLRR